MAEPAYSANWIAETPQLGMPALWRLLAWGGLATVALFVAVIFAYSNTGSQRQAAAIAAGQISANQVVAIPISSGQAPPGAAALQPRIPSGEFGPRPSETAEETRRLAEAVRALTADRDQALARIVALERNLDGVTGSIKRDRTASLQPTAPPATPQIPSPAASAAPAASPPPAARPEAPAARPEPDARSETPAPPVKETATTAPPPVPASQSPATGDTAPMAAPVAGNRAVASASTIRAGAPAEPLEAAAGLGVDVGGAINYEGLRALWRTTRNSHPELLDDVYPVVTVRENGKTHGVDLRLVLGPIADVETASRLCTTLAAARHYCQPVSFEGQRLTMNDTVPTPKAAPPPPTHHGSPSPPPEFSPHLRALNWK